MSSTVKDGRLVYKCSSLVGLPVRLITEMNI
jgi:hypothetical protein